MLLFVISPFCIYHFVSILRSDSTVLKEKIAFPIEVLSTKNGIFPEHFLQT